MHFLVKISFLGILVVVMVKEVSCVKEEEPQTNSNRQSIQPSVISDSQNIIEYFKTSSRIVALQGSSDQAPPGNSAQRPFTPSTSTSSSSRPISGTEDIFCKPNHDTETLSLKKDVCIKILRAFGLTYDYVKIELPDEMQCQDIEFFVEDSSYTTFQKIPCPYMGTGRRLKLYVTYIDFSPSSNSYSFCTFIERNDKKQTIKEIVKNVVLGDLTSEDDHEAKSVWL